MAESRAAGEGRRQAQAVRSQHGLGNAPIRDLFGFVERKYPAVLVVRYPMPEAEGPAGALVDLGGRCLLAVNSAGRDLGRQRFTTAHLLGHFLFDADRSPLHLDRHLPGAILPAEVRADTFAAHLLLPEAVVRERAVSTRSDLADDAKLAALALEYGMCSSSLAWYLDTLVSLGDDDRRRIAAIDVGALAARMGMADTMRRERAARDALGWSGHYLSLAVAAYDRQLWSRQELCDALEDHALVEEITGPSPGVRHEASP